MADMNTEGCLELAKQAGLGEEVAQKMAAAHMLERMKRELPL